MEVNFFYIGNHKELKVWQESMDLVVEIYKLTVGFPKEVIYGLSSHMKRSVVSIPSNIAEGSGRKSKAEYMRFLYIALGSAAELETQIEIAHRLQFVAKTDYYDNKIRLIKSMLSKLIKGINGTE